jgi:fructokinase
LGKRWSKLTGKNQSIQEILNNRGHQFFDVWKSEFLTHFGFGIANLISILDPDIIILGGGLSNIEFLYDEGIKTVATNLPRHLKPVPIVRNSLGDSAGSLGAALLTSL